MEFLLEARWNDPIGNAVARILSSVPEGTEQTTGHVPQGQGRAFGLFRSESVEVLDALARAISSAGARVQVTRVVEEGVPGELGGGRGGSPADKKLAR